MSIKTWAVVAALFGASVAQAQVTALPSAADAQALACLQRGSGKLTYPTADLAERKTGTLRYSLHFTAPDRPPEAKLIFRAATDAMAAEVEAVIRHYRLPCLADGPVTAIQEFAFEPRAPEPISWSPLRPSPALDDTTQRMACLVTPKEALAFSGSSRQREVSNVFVDAGFTAPDAPPTVKLSYSSADKGKERDVMDYVARYRLPCLPAGAKPAWMRQHFQFSPDDVARRVFNDATTLSRFLGGVKGLRDQTASFDFDSMGCPFQVAWTLGRPKLDNRVGQVGKPDPNRIEFLAWLSGLELAMKDAQYEQLVGQTLIINIGCGKLDLGS